MSKSCSYLESIWCPIRKGTELMFLALKWRGEKYWWSNVTLSRLSHADFGISQWQCQKIINDFRAYGIMQWWENKKKRDGTSYPNKYTIPLFVIKFFKKVNTVFKSIKDMNVKIFNKNNSMTMDLAHKILKRLWINTNINLETVNNWDYWYDTVLYSYHSDEVSHEYNGRIIYKTKYMNLFDYIKTNSNRPMIELCNIFIKTI